LKNRDKHILMAKTSKIQSLKAREILDSRGSPAVEVEIETDFGISRASVPSGASKGKYEAVELRDGGKRYQGKGVLKAVRNVNNVIGPKLRGRDVTKQREIDELMIKLDGTKNKSKLGANAICGVSMAVCRTGAAVENIPLYEYILRLTFPKSNTKLFTIVKSLGLVPQSCFNMINGGLHAGNELDFQEFMVVPQYENFSKNLQIATEIYQELKKIIKEKYIDLAINLGDEGGFAPPIRAPEEALNLILEAAKKLGYQNKIKIILDIAASQFFKKGKYKMKIGEFSRKRLVDYYLDLIQKYPLRGLEDPFGEEDFEGWQMTMSNVKCQMSNVLIIGDDLLVTNPKRIKMAEKKNLCNGTIIKINQIGTVSEAIEAVKLAKSFNWKIVVSHRSGETLDDFIADFSVGIGADFIKAGAPARGERVAKYNRLLRIEEKLRSATKFSEYQPSKSQRDFGV
jgi:enolase